MATCDDMYSSRARRRATRVLHRRATGRGVLSRRQAVAVTASVLSCTDPTSKPRQARTETCKRNGEGWHVADPHLPPTVCDEQRGAGRPRTAHRKICRQG